MSANNDATAPSALTERDNTAAASAAAAAVAAAAALSAASVNVDTAAVVAPGDDAAPAGQVAARDDVKGDDTTPTEDAASVTAPHATMQDGNAATMTAASNGDDNNDDNVDDNTVNDDDNDKSPTRAAATTMTGAVQLYEAPHTVTYYDVPGVSTHTQLSDSTRQVPRHRQQQQQQQQQRACRSAVGDVVCSHFSRGYDNSHVNRMATGSYSRYLEVAGELPMSVLLDTFYGSLPTVAYSGARNVDEGAASSGGGGGDVRGSDANNNSSSSSRYSDVCSGSGGAATVALAHASSTTPVCEVRQRVTRYYGRLVRRNSAATARGGAPVAEASATRTGVVSTAAESRSGGSQHGRDHGGARDVRHATPSAMSQQALVCDVLPSPSPMRARTEDGSAGTRTHLLRREYHVLGPGLSDELVRERERRKRDPRHSGCGGGGRGSYVYYNHNSKAYYVPHKPADNTLRLRYDDLHEFGDGTRFVTTRGDDADGQWHQHHHHHHHHLRTGTGALHVRNPRASPPETYGEWYARTLPARPIAAATTRTQRQGQSRAMTLPHPPDGGDRQGVSHGVARGAAAFTSLRTATALDPRTLHCGRAQRTRTLEETLAEREGSYVRSGSSLRRAVAEGKISEHQLPQGLRLCCEAAAAAAATATTDAQGVGNGYVSTAAEGERSATAAAACTTATTAAMAAAAADGGEGYLYPHLAGEGGGGGGGGNGSGRGRTQATVALEAPLAFTLRTDAGVRGAVYRAPTMHSRECGGGSGGFGGKCEDDTQRGRASARNGTSLPALQQQQPYTISRLHYKQKFSRDVTPSAFVISSQ